MSRSSAKHVCDKVYTVLGSAGYHKALVRRHVIDAVKKMTHALLARGPVANRGPTGPRAHGLGTWALGTWLEEMNQAGPWLMARGHGPWFEGVFQILLPDSSIRAERLGGLEL